MPACAVQRHNGMSAWRDVTTDLGEMQVHPFCVGIGKNETGCEPAFGADRAEQIGPVVALVARRGGTAAALGPDAG